MAPSSSNVSVSSSILENLRRDEHASLVCHRIAVVRYGAITRFRCLIDRARRDTRVAMTVAPTDGATQRRLAILLAMAMFVLVVDTSLMNVSISAVIRDLHTTASGVQS